MFASFPMYQRPELVGAHNDLWHHIKVQLDARGIPAPMDLDQDRIGVSDWSDPLMVLSQTCGLPYVRHLLDKVQLVGTFDYGLKECEAGFYYSVLIAKKGWSGSLDGAHFTYNELGSQSGYAVAEKYAKSKNISLIPSHASGAHLNSIKAVQSGTAELAFIDAITWAYATRYDNLDDLYVVDTTPPTPTLPLITSTSQNPKQLFQAVQSALGSLSTATKDQLTIKGLVHLDKSIYQTYIG